MDNLTSIVNGIYSVSPFALFGLLIWHLVIISLNSKIKSKLVSALEESKKLADNRKLSHDKCYDLLVAKKKELVASERLKMMAIKSVEEKKDKIKELIKERSELMERNDRLFRSDKEKLNGIIEIKDELDRLQMNLSPKYNPNVTRGADGRFKSLK
jgi:biopolymer transport protein ExbB/TolQ